MEHQRSELPPRVPVSLPGMREAYPWTSLKAAAAYRITAPARLTAPAVTVPGSKSLSVRALLLAAVAQGSSVLRNVLDADDTRFALACLTQLGIAWHLGEEGEITVHGGSGRLGAASGVLDLGYAGTLARFLPGLLAACGQGTYHVTGHSSLQRRPLQPLLVSLRQLGAQIDAESLPLHLTASALGGETQIAGSVSSQFASGILLAAPFGRQPVVLTLTYPLVQPAYVDMTLAYLRSFGAQVEAQEVAGGQRYVVQPGPLLGQRLEVEAVASSAGYFFALAAITGQPLAVGPFAEDLLQPDIRLLDALQEMGCSVRRTGSMLTVRRDGPLRGGMILNLQAYADQAPTLAAVAAFADGPLTLTNIGHIRYHESDRIALLAENLTKLGIRVQITQTSLTVWPWQRPDRDVSNVWLETHFDHRMAMALSLLAVGGGSVTVRDPGCVCKTFPHYFATLQACGFLITDCLE